MTETDLPTITSLRNRRIVEARKLTQRKHRERQGRFLVEGLQIIHMALDALAQPSEAFFCSSQLASEEGRALVGRLRQTGTAVWPVSPAVMGSLCERDAPQGLVVAFELPRQTLEDVQLAGNSLVVIADRLQDPGNLGTIIRTADAVGASGVVLIEPSADPCDPKTVRATMGSLFSQPVVRTHDVDALFQLLGDRGVRTVGAGAHQGSAWGEGLLAASVALVLGNEARGVSEDVRGYIQAWAHLPVRGDAESLNVAVAGGVLMYAWLRAHMG